MNIYTTVLPVIAMLLFGFAANKFHLMSEEGIQGMKSFVVNITLPAVLFSALYTVDFNWKVFSVAGIMFIICCIAFFLGKILSRFFSSAKNLIPFMTTGFEAGMMGYALFAMLFGAENTGFFAIVDLGQVIFVFTLYLGLLNASDGISAKQTLKNMCVNPSFLAIALGLIVNLSGLTSLISDTLFGDVLASILSYVSAPTGAVILFTIGYGLSFSGSLIKSAVSTSVVRLAIMGVLCAIFIALSNIIFANDPTFREYIPKAALLMFSLPAPFVFPVYAKKEEDVHFSATFLSFYTLVSIALFVIIAAVQ